MTAYEMISLGFYGSVGAILGVFAVAGICLFFAACVDSLAWLFGKTEDSWQAFRKRNRKAE